MSISDIIIDYLNSIHYRWEATITPYGGTFYFHNDRATAEKVLDHLKDTGYYDKLSGSESSKLMRDEYHPGEINGLRPGEYNYYIYWRN